MHEQHATLSEDASFFFSRFMSKDSENNRNLHQLTKKQTKITHKHNLFQGEGDYTVPHESSSALLRLVMLVTSYQHHHHPFSFSQNNNSNIVAVHCAIDSIMKTIIRRMTYNMGTTNVHTSLASIWSSAISWSPFHTTRNGGAGYSTDSSENRPRSLLASAFSIPKKQTPDERLRLVRALIEAKKEIGAASVVITTVEDNISNERDMHFERLHLDSDSLGAGEDAFFIAPLHDRKLITEKHHYATETRVVGVFDGVGGWAQYGVDPSEVSRAMMRAARSLTSDYEGEVIGRYGEDPVKLLRATYDTAVRSGEARIGSTTACLLLLDSKGRIQSANLGDSGFIVLRRKPQEEIDGLMENAKQPGKYHPLNIYDVVHRSSEQQHYFNAPYQLSILPKNQQKGSLRDDPEDADRYHDLHVESGDLIIVATDGVFDNLFDSHIASIVTTEDMNHFKKERFLFSAAREICVTALNVGHMKNVDTPFVRSVPRNMVFRDGKPDDCTVVIAQVIGTNSEDAGRDQIKED